MTLIELLVVLFLCALFMSKGERKQRSFVRHVKLKKSDIGPPPVTPGPRYICANCGMLIETGHGHTREECEARREDLSLGKPNAIDHRIRHVLEGSNDPRVRKPNYYEAGTFKNWGAGK